MKYFFLLFLLTINCAKAQKNNVMNIDQISKTVSQFGTHPNYSIQLDKGGCKVELLGNDLPLWKAFERGGFSSLIPFNLNILKSGKQILTARIYPDQERLALDEYTRVSLQVIYFENDKNPNSPRKIITEYVLPKDIIAKNLPYYEVKLNFDATVPYELGKELEKAKKLSAIPKIEQKALATYKKVNHWVIDKDLNSLSNFRRNADIKYCLAFYIEDPKEIEKEFDYSFLFENKSKPNELPDYDIKYYADDKVIELVNKKTKGDLISLTGYDEDNDEVLSTVVLKLYMPEDSDELKPF